MCVCVYVCNVSFRELIDNNRPHDPLSRGHRRCMWLRVWQEKEVALFRLILLIVIRRPDCERGQSPYSASIFKKELILPRGKKAGVIPDRGIIFLAGDMPWLWVKMPKCFCYHVFTTNNSDT